MKLVGNWCMCGGSTWHTQHVPQTARGNWEAHRSQRAGESIGNRMGPLPGDSLGVTYGVGEAQTW